VLERLLQEIMQAGDRIVVVSNSTKVIIHGNCAAASCDTLHTCNALMATKAADTRRRLWSLCKAYAMRMAGPLCSSAAMSVLPRGRTL
jgi:hypothetical protein